MELSGGVRLFSLESDPGFESSGLFSCATGGGVGAVVLKLRLRC